MSQAKRVCLVAIALALGALLAGCVLIPYTPTAESRHDATAVEHPERLRISVGPRELLSGLESGVVARDARVQPVPGQTVLDIASSDGELTLGRLFAPAMRARIAPLELDYFVLVGDLVRKEEGQFGGIVPYFGLWGLEHDTESISLWTAVIDARELSVVRQSTSKATGSFGAIGWVFMLGVVADTREGALRGAVTQVVETIAAARSSGPVRVAFLAVEPIGTAPVRSSLQYYPPFQEAPPPPGHGLVYVYRPEKDLGCFDSVDVQTRSAVSAADVSRLRCGGYYPLYLPDGAAMPGARLRSADASPAVDLCVRGGETYYVRVSADMKSGSRPISRASLVGAGEASAELRSCRLMPSAYEHDLETMRRAEAGDSEAQLESARLYAAGIKYVDGQMLPQDRAEAYKWYSIVESSGFSDAISFYAGEQRDKLTVGMDAAEMAEAKRRAQAWRDAWRESFVPRGPELAEPRD